MAGASQAPSGVPGTSSRGGGRISVTPEQLDAIGNMPAEHWQSIGRGLFLPSTPAQAGPAAVPGYGIGGNLAYSGASRSFLDPNAPDAFRPWGNASPQGVPTPAGNGATVNLSPAMAENRARTMRMTPGDASQMNQRRANVQYGGGPSGPWEDAYAASTLAPSGLTKEQQAYLDERGLRGPQGPSATLSATGLVPYPHTQPVQLSPAMQANRQRTLAMQGKPSEEQVSEAAAFRSTQGLPSVKTRGPIRPDAAVGVPGAGRQQPQGAIDWANMGPMRPGEPMRQSPEWFRWARANGAIPTGPTGVTPLDRQLAAQQPLGMGMAVNNWDQANAREQAMNATETRNQQAFNRGMGVPTPSKWDVPYQNALAQRDAWRGGAGAPGVPGPAGNAQAQAPVPKVPGMMTPLFPGGKSWKDIGGVDAAALNSPTYPGLREAYIDAARTNAQNVAAGGKDVGMPPITNFAQGPMSGVSGMSQNRADAIDAANARANDRQRMQDQAFGATLAQRGQFGPAERFMSRLQPGDPAAQQMLDVVNQAKHDALLRSLAPAERAGVLGTRLGIPRGAAGKGGNILEADEGTQWTYQRNMLLAKYMDDNKGQPFDPEKAEKWLKTFGYSKDDKPAPKAAGVPTPAGGYGNQKNWNTAVPAKAVPEKQKVIRNTADVTKGAANVATLAGTGKEMDAITAWRAEHPDSKLTDQEIMDTVINPINKIPGTMQSLAQGSVPFGEHLNPWLAAYLGSVSLPFSPGNAAKAIYNAYLNNQKRQELAK